MVDRSVCEELELGLALGLGLAPLTLTLTLTADPYPSPNSSPDPHQVSRRTREESSVYLLSDAIFLRALAHLCGATQG